ncbi:MAG: hypothetical protein FVQ80_17750 [Planctomycetes bacterium]|nr:hypothetical protein [Planctomycetota bacterium]
MNIKSHKLLSILAIFLFYGCQTTYKLAIPEIDPDVAQEEREFIYENYKLEYFGSILTGSYFQQDDSIKFPYPVAGELFEHSSEEAKLLYSSGSATTITAGIIGGVGGGLIGYPLGTAIGGKKWETVDYILLGSGAGLSIVSFIVAEVGISFFSDATEEYNRHLRELLKYEE